ncbi:MAG: DUF3021 domain-containing protein [Lachnospiraceae bacterium]|nr:DUF3021 domain-containing protein [Lachnospiraceae bacterium]
MNKKNQGISVWMRLLAQEIGVEFKASIYFLCVLAFYAIYRLLCGSLEASILHMVEMVCMTYVMGYVQLYLFDNFDEGEQLRGKEICYLLLCASIYALVSYWGRWFEGDIMVSVVFELYMIFAYFCAFLIYKIKRSVDEKLLNADLRAFQERRLEDGGV